MQHKQSGGDSERRWPCLLAPYLTQFPEVSRRRITPIERKVSSVGCRQAEHLLRMDSEFDVVAVEPVALHSEIKIR